MTECIYSPEGDRLKSTENLHMTSDLRRIQRAISEGSIIEGLVTKCDCDTMDLYVDVGPFKGVIPRDEVLFCRNGEEPKDIAIITRVGKAAAFKILAVDYCTDGEPFLILSRKAAQEECYSAYIDRLRPGDIIPATVTHMESFGAFLDIGCGIVSLMTVDSISVSRISHPRDRFKCGDSILCVVKSIDRESGRIYMSSRELLGTWEENVAEFRQGQTVTGVVRSIEEYGIFVELTPNLAGLAERKDGVEIGEVCAVYIKSIIPERMKIKLVLIDSTKSTYERGLDYRIDAVKTRHIDSWQYSPQGCSKVIETVFEG
ncbi:MAG: S1 RNA-binding domain-containing protein [Clostridia bacterium]|nr:S1 RNA-binding domain-containing protein [Clostridia bacterium]